MVDYRLFILVGSILTISLVINLLINRAFLPWMNRYLERNYVEKSRMIVRSVQRFLQFWIIIGGSYIISYLFFRGLSQYESINSFFSVILIASILYYVYKSITTINYYYIRNGKLPDTTLFDNILKLVFILLSSLIITNALGYSVVPIAATFGVGAIAIALALRDPLSNLFAGIAIITSKQINIGDFVRIDKFNEGYIHDLTWRYTVIRTIENNLVIISNSILASHILVNFSLPQKTLTTPIPIRVSYDCDLPYVENITLEIAREFQQTYDGADKNFEPRFRVIALGDYGIDLKVILGISQYEVQHPMRSEFLKRIRKVYRELGIGIPFPTNTILFEH